MYTQNSFLFITAYVFCKDTYFAREAYKNTIEVFDYATEKYGATIAVYINGSELKSELVNNYKYTSGDHILALIYFTIKKKVEYVYLPHQMPDTTLTLPGVPADACATGSWLSHIAIACTAPKLDVTFEKTSDTTVTFNVDVGNVANTWFWSEHRYIASSLLNTSTTCTFDPDTFPGETIGLYWNPSETKLEAHAITDVIPANAILIWAGFFSSSWNLKYIVFNAKTMALNELAAAANPKKYASFSILGDSISTFKGHVTPSSNALWYPDAAVGNDVTAVEDTWWYKFATEYGCALQVNNSYSGSPVCYDGYGSGTSDAKGYCFATRAAEIGKPDLILVFGGTNDNWAGSGIGEYEYTNWNDENMIYFRPACAYMLNYIKQHNIGAKIIFILNENLKDSIDESVLTICNHYNVPVLSLSGVKTVGGHPNKEGMNTICQQLIDMVNSL